MGDPSFHAGTAVSGLELGGELVADVEAVRPGATLPGERRYFAMPDGSVAVRELRAPADGEVAHALIVAPAGGVEINAEVGVARLEAGRQALAEAAALERVRAADLRAADHGALVALGLPDDVAARLTGHR